MAVSLADVRPTTRHVTEYACNRCPRTFTRIDSFLAHECGPLKPEEKVRRPSLMELLKGVLTTHDGAAMSDGLNADWWCACGAKGTNGGGDKALSIACEARVNHVLDEVQRARA